MDFKISSNVSGILDSSRSRPNLRQWILKSRVELWGSLSQGKAPVKVKSKLGYKICKFQKITIKEFMAHIEPRFDIVLRLVLHTAVIRNRPVGVSAQYWTRSGWTWLFPTLPSQSKVDNEDLVIHLRLRKSNDEITRFNVPVHPISIMEWPYARKSFQAKFECISLS